MMDPDERRKHPRLAISVDVDFVSGSNFFAGKTRDVSMGGLFIEAPVLLAVGTELVVEVKIPDRHFKIASEVAWVLLGDNDLPVGFGVRFVDLAASQKRAIESFLEVRSPIAYEFEPEADVKREAKGPPKLPAR